jgi:hypothetical protein
MIEKDVIEISQLFGIEKEIVEASEKDGTLSQRIKDSLAKKKVFAVDEFDKFKTNYAKEVKDNFFDELVEKTRKGDAPNELHKAVKGAFLQQKEREYAKKFDITEYSDFDDLVEKAISKTTATGKKPEVDKLIQDLREANTKLVQEKDNAVKDVEARFKSQSIERDKKDLISKVPFDFSDKKADEIENAKQKTQNILKSVFDQEYRLDYDDKGRLVVIDKEGKIKKNQATLEPVDPSNVMVDLAKDYNLKLQSPDRGGQGGKSSQSSGQMFSSQDEYEAYCKANNKSPYDKDMVKLWKASGLLKQ